MPSRQLQAFLLFLGVAGGFIGAVWFGRGAVHYSKPDRFVRFHPGISIETSFYPTFAMMEQIARSRWQPGQTLVIIAGNSILNGQGQSDEEVWSRHLQEELGGGYAVVNLSFRGTLPGEGGALVAEALHREGLPVVLVTNTAPGTVGRVAGGPFGYLYWDAYYKRRLYPYPMRRANLSAWEATTDAVTRERLAEERRAARLDGLFRFQSLWHHIGYRHVFTVWSPSQRWRFWEPRSLVPDRMPTALPLERRFHDHFEIELEITRGFTVNLAGPSFDGGWEVYDAPRQVAADLIQAMFVPPLRPRTLVLLNQNAPIYRDALSPPERARDELVFASYRGLWQSFGFACVIAGTDFENADYADRTHLATSGGQKLAHLVAEHIRLIAP